MKKFITLKVGYTAGIDGCTNEYFTTIIINGNKISSVSHRGMYGSEERINEALENKGFTKEYISNDFGKMKAREVWKGFIREEEAVEKIKKDY